MPQNKIKNIFMVPTLKELTHALHKASSQNVHKYDIFKYNFKRCTKQMSTDEKLGIFIRCVQKHYGSYEIVSALL